MFVDVFWIFLLLIQFFLFSVGVATCGVFWTGRIRYDWLPLFFSVGTLFITALTSLLACIPFASVSLGTLLVGVLEALGVVSLIRHPQRLKGASGIPIDRGRCPYGRGGLGMTGGVLFLGSLSIWWLSWEGTPAIISYNDGLAHMGYLARIIDAGTPLLPFIPRPFLPQFGGDTIPFYPTGTHALIPFFQGWWIQMEWLTQAQAMRSWMLLTHALLPLLVVWIVRMVFPGRSRWLSFGVGALAFTYWLYPVWAANSGGYSRAVGQFLVLPLVVWIVKQGLFQQEKRPTSWIYLLLIPGCVATFAYHPSSFTIFALNIGVVFLLQSFFHRKDKAWVLRNAGIYLGSLILGMILLAGFLQWTASISTLDGQKPVFHVNPFTIEAWYTRLGALGREFLHAGYSPPFGWALYQCVLMLGAGVVLWRGLSPLFLYFVTTSILVLMLMSTYFAPFYTVYRVGLLYLHYPSRLAETQYLCAILLWAQGGMGIGSAYTYLKQRGGGLHQAFIVGVVVLSILEFRVAVKSQIRHLRAYRDIYHTQTYEKTEKLMEYVRTHTEKKAIFLYAPQVADSLESRTGRMGLFTYGECKGLGGADPACEKRMAFSQAIHTELQEWLKMPDVTQSCFASLASFPLPLYWITEVGSFPNSKVAPCKNLQWVKEEGAYSIWKYAP